MTQKSLVQRTVDEVVQIVHRTLTKPLGYSKKNRSLIRPSNGLFHVVEIHCSRWGSATTGGFEIALSIVWPYLHKAYCGKPVPTNPASAVPAIQQGIGFLMPERMSKSWYVNQRSAPEVLAVEVCFVIEKYGFPFLRQFSTIESVLEFLIANRDPLLAPCSPEYLRAIALCYSGDRVAAARTLREMVSSKRPQPWDETVELLLNRLGLQDVH